jgi:AdoMet-dependent heme synthase
VKLDFDQRPFVVIWETTQACELACVHCRACAQPARSALELSTEEAKRLIDEVAPLEAPVFVLTGGDPLKRPDIFELVEYASTHGVRISLTPSATPLLTREAILRLKQCGLARLAISLDGPTADAELTGSTLRPDDRDSVFPQLFAAGNRTVLKTLNQISFR